MARIVGGFASSHTPLMSLPGQDWAKRAEDDKRNRELIRPSDGAHVTYEELLASANPAIKEELSEDVFCRKFAAIQENLNALQDAFVETDPDVVVLFGDDQDEMFFEDNYPMISVYWGDVLTHYPRSISLRPGASEAIRIASAVYGTEIIDYPVQTTLGRHLVSYLGEHDFDVASSRYMKAEYGGSIGPGTWYLDFQRKTEPRRQGIAHAFPFPVCRWFGGKRPPMVPSTINTC